MLDAEAIKTIRTADLILLVHGAYRPDQVLDALAPTVASAIHAAARCRRIRVSEKTVC